MAIQESGEMYLETILVLSQKQTNVRSIDISEEMNYSKPSVSRAVGILKKDGYILVDGSGYITLTEKGRELAETIYQRHQILSHILMSLGVDEKTAIADACRIEHVISEDSMDAIKQHMKDHEVVFE
ncbi:MAG: metal-dependent transcriptional regulator [Firmicutes bacterium]|nr:metal-dependent transcriptional regulator [Bacillota bacterium]